MLNHYHHTIRSTSKESDNPLFASDSSNHPQGMTNASTRMVSSIPLWQQRNIWLALLLFIFSQLSLLGCRNSHYEKGEIYLREGRLDQAEQEFHHSIANKKENSDTYKAYIGLGKVYIEKKEYQQALEYLQTAIDHAPTTVTAREYMARVYIIRGQLDYAIQICEEASAISPRVDTYNLQGLAYLGKQDAPKAEEAFKQAIQIQPDDAAAQMNLADLYVRMGKNDLAELHYQKLLADHPERKAGYMKLAQLYIRQSQLDKAEQMYRTVSEKEPQDLPSRRALGRLYTIQRKYDAAISTYESALKLAPSDLQIHSSLISLYNQVNRFADAIKQGKTFEKLLPIDVPADSNQAQLLRSSRAFLYINLGRAYLGHQDYFEAIKYLQQYVNLNPEDAVAHYRLGLAYTGINNHTQAISEYKRAIELDNNLAVAYLRLANAHIAMGEHSQAIRACQKITVSNPSNSILANDIEKAEAYHLSGIAYLAMSDSKNALGQLQKALELNPDDPNAYVTIGNFYRQQKRLNDAMKHYQMAIERDPEIASAYHQLAQVYQQLGDPAKMVEMYDKAIALNPNSANAHNDFAWHYAELGTNLDKALNLAKRAVEIEPKSSAFRDTLGWIYYKKAMYPQAITELMTATLGTPNSSEIQFHLGMAYYANSEYRNARQQLSAALNHNGRQEVLAAADQTQANKTLQQIEAKIGESGGKPAESR